MLILKVCIICDVLRRKRNGNERNSFSIQTMPIVVYYGVSDKPNYKISYDVAKAKEKSSPR